MSSSDSQSLTYESILESFGRQFRSKKSLICDYSECNKTFGTQSRLDGHKRRRHGVEDNIPRELIGNSTDAKVELMTAHNDSQPQPMATPTDRPVLLKVNTSLYECPHEGCGHSYDTKRRLKRHRLSVLSNAGQQCVHSSIASPVKQYDCIDKDCDQWFDTIRALKRHRRAVHSATGRQ
ncbi:unnamed protein product, partial [Medioppia subpectinata]